MDGWKGGWMVWLWIVMEDYWFIFSFSFFLSSLSHEGSLGHSRTSKGVMGDTRGVLEYCWLLSSVSLLQVMREV